MTYSGGGGPGTGAETDTLLRTYGWSPGGVLLTITDHSTTPSKTYLPVSDGNGNITSLITTSGTVAATYIYDAFGNPVSHTGTGIADANPMRWGGGYFDVETQLYYNLNRYYSPVQGRFLTRDPIAEAGGLNLYAYCQNDPVNYSDPMGFEPLFGWGPHHLDEWGVLNSALGYRPGVLSSFPTEDVLRQGPEQALQALRESVRKVNPAAYQRYLEQVNAGSIPRWGYAARAAWLEEEMAGAIAGQRASETRMSELWWQSIHNDTAYQRYKEFEKSKFAFLEKQFAAQLVINLLKAESAAMAERNADYLANKNGDLIPGYMQLRFKNFWMGVWEQIGDQNSATNNVLMAAGAWTTPAPRGGFAPRIESTLFYEQPVVYRATSFSNVTTMQLPTMRPANLIRIEEFLKVTNSDTLIHITSASRSQLNVGVYPESSWVKYKDVAKMTIPEFKANVVLPIAEGHTLRATAFVTRVAQPGEFIRDPRLWNYNGIAPEYTNPFSIKPDSYIEVPALRALDR